MAMTLDPAAQSAIPSEIDYDMAAEQEGNNADFNIDIELDGDHDDIDIQVNDPTQQEIDDLHYDDEIMYEGTGAQPEMEMWEGQGEHQADQDMDDTIYHEAESHLFNDQQPVNVDDNADVVEENAEDTSISELAAGHVGDAINQEHAALNSTHLSLGQTEAKETESVATSMTLDAGSGENETSALNNDDIATTEDFDEYEEDEVEHAEGDEDAQNDESQSEELDAGEKDAEVPPFSAEASANRDEELLRQENAQPEADYDSNSDDGTDESQQLEMASQTDEKHVEELNKSSADEMYNVMVQFKGQTLQLFPDEVSNGLDACLLQDVSLAERPVVELLSACRAQLADAVHANEILGIEVRGLQLTILETDDDCSEITLSQIIDVYHHLHSNEETYEPDQLLLELTLRSRPLNRLKQLFHAAEAGKGYSVLGQLSAEIVDYDDEEVDNSDEESLDHPTEDSPVQNGIEEHPSKEANAVNTAITAEAAEFVYGNTAGTIGNIDDEHLTSNDQSTEQQLHITNNDIQSGQEVEPELDFEAEDLIDYTDNEEQDHESIKEAPGSANVHDIVESRNDTHEDEVGGEANNATAMTKTWNAPSADVQHDIFETEPDEINGVQEDLRDDTTQINTYKDDGLTEEQWLQAVDDTVDFDLPIATNEHKIVNEDGTTAVSPSGKRSWEEHAGDDSVAQSGQDSKRVRADG